MNQTRFLSSLTVAFGILVSSSAVVADGIGGGGPLFQQNQPCVSPAERAEVQQIIAEYKRGTGIQRQSQHLGDAPLYTFYPMSGILYRDLFTLNFVDLDPTSGILDWDCTGYTYNGHDATDTLIRSFGEQAIGVPIFSALDGVVISTHDGEEDEHTQCQGIGNHVIIDHGFGRIAYYWHFKKNSIVVSVGQSVLAGEELGLTGSSGCSNYPHLHFATYDDDVLVEPYTGDCNPGSSGWEDQTPIERDLYLLDFAVTRQDMNGQGPPPLVLPRDGQIGLDDSYVYFWIMAMNFPAYTTWQVEFQRPNGTIAFDSGVEPFGNPSFRRGLYGWWYYDITEMHEITGTWHIRLYLNSELMVSAPVEVVKEATPDFNRAPEAITVEIHPPNPTVDDVLICRVNSSMLLDDLDYDIVRYDYVWTLNGEEIRTITSAAHTDVIPHHMASPCDVVACEVTPADDQISGPTAQATTVISGDPPADLDCDGCVGPFDLALLLGAWGPNPGDPADLDGDGGVGPFDLALLLGNWTSCP